MISGKCLEGFSVNILAVLGCSLLLGYFCLLCFKGFSTLIFYVEICCQIASFKEINCHQLEKSLTHCFCLVSFSCDYSFLHLFTCLLICLLHVTAFLVCFYVLELR